MEWDYDVFNRTYKSGPYRIVWKPRKRVWQLWHEQDWLGNLVTSGLAKQAAEEHAKAEGK